MIIDAANKTEPEIIADLKNKGISDICTVLKEKYEISMYVLYQYAKRKQVNP